MVHPTWLATSRSMQLFYFDEEEYDVRRSCPVVTIIVEVRVSWPNTSVIKQIKESVKNTKENLRNVLCACTRPPRVSPMGRCTCIEYMLHCPYHIFPHEKCLSEGSHSNELNQNKQKNWVHLSSSQGKTDNSFMFLSIWEGVLQMCFGSG